MLPLLGARRRALALDTAGFGESDPVPAASIEAWAGAALEALDALGIARAHVVGHHTGGVIAVELAARAPDRVASLVLSSTPYTDAAFRRARAERPPIDAVAPSGDGSHLAALWQKRQPFYPAERPELLQAFVADALKASGDLEAGHRAVASYRMEERLGAVQAPVLLLHASDDPFAAPHLAEWRRLLPQAQVATIAGGVPLPDQMPAEFAAAVLDFVDAHAMKAMRIHGWGEAPRQEDLAEPEPRAGRTLVRMAATTASHLDRSIAAGGFLRHPPLPYVPGVEAAGTVLQGERFPAGTRVWLRGAGLGTVEDGTWRETISAPDAALGLLPDAIPMPLGAAFFSPCTAAWVALFGPGALQPGERVRVSGASGAVGGIAVQLARAAGARVAIDGDAADGAAPGFDLLIDCVGGPALPGLLAGLVPGGRAVLIGYTAGRRVELDLAELMQRDLRLLPLNMLRREAEARAAAPELLARLADGRLQLALRSFALSQAAEAMAWIVARGHRGRAVLVPDEPSPAPRAAGSGPG